MTTLYTQSGLLLTNNNKLAISNACCCLCWKLTPCNGAPPIYTKTDLTSFAGHVVLYNNICYTVSSSKVTCGTPLQNVSGLVIQTNCTTCEVGTDCNCCQPSLTPKFITIDVPKFCNGLLCTFPVNNPVYLGPGKITFQGGGCNYTCVSAIDNGEQPHPSCCGLTEYSLTCAPFCWTASFSIGSFPDCVPTFILNSPPFVHFWKYAGTWPNPKPNCLTFLNGLSLTYFSGTPHLPSTGPNPICPFIPGPVVLHTS